MEAATALTPLPSQSLYDLEQNLQALLDTEALVTAEDEEAFRTDLAEAFAHTIAKRDRCAQFLAHCESQIAQGRLERERIAKREKMFQGAADRLRTYLALTIQSLGKDEKGKWRKLEGQTSTFGLREGRTSVNITDATMLPARFRSVEVQFSMTAFEYLIQLCASAPQVLAILENNTVELAPDKNAISAALKRGEDVPGAELEFGTPILVMT